MACCIYPKSSLCFPYVLLNLNLTDTDFRACCERSCDEQNLHYHQSTFLQFYHKRLWQVVQCETGSYPCKFYTRNAHKCNHKHQLHNLPHHVSSFIATITNFLQHTINIVIKDSMRVSSFNCYSVSGMAKVFKEMPLHRQQQNTVVLLGYLKRSDSVIHEPGRADTVCVMGFSVWNVLKSTDQIKLALKFILSTSQKPC